MEQVATNLTVHDAFFQPRVFSLSEFSLSLANSRQLSSTLIDFVLKLIGSIRRKIVNSKIVLLVWHGQMKAYNYNSRSLTNPCLSNRSHQVLTSFIQQKDEPKQLSYKLLSISTIIRFYPRFMSSKEIKNIQP